MARSVQPDASRRVYGYCRVSTAGQADSGISLDEQEHRIRARWATISNYALRIPPSLI
jgi:DNA invertase Pin-like site-specific DNA recombinase